MIFKILAVGFSITAYKTVIETAYCVPLYYAILIKFYVPMYIQQNKRIKAILWLYSYSNFAINRQHKKLNHLAICATV